MPPRGTRGERVGQDPGVFEGETMRADPVYFRPVLPLLCCLILGLLVGCYLPGRELWAGLLAAVCGGVICCRLAKNSAAVISPLVLFFTLGYLAIQPWADPPHSARHVAHYTDSGAFDITGTVAGTPLGSPRRLRFVVAVESLGARDAVRAVTGKISVSAWGKSAPLRDGDRVSLTGRIKSIQNFNNPGRFDYRRYMHFQGIRGRVDIPAADLKILGRRPAAGFSVMAPARRKISTLIEQAAAKDAGGVLKALVIGDREDISPELRTAFDRAGVGHLLAISGLHVGIIAAVAFALFRRLLNRSRFVLERAWTRKGAAVLAALPVLLYGYLAGMSPSTQRAVIMVVVFLAACLLEKEAEPINTLGTAAFLILVLYPPALFSISFQLSFGAVFAILYGLGKTRGRDQPPQSLPRIGYHLVSFALVSCFAIAGTLPLVMFYFNRISLVGFFANLLLIPLVGFAAVPLGLLAAFTLSVSANAAFWLMQAAAFLVSKALLLIRLFADLPWAAVSTFTPTTIEIACYYLLFGSLLNLARPPAGPDAGQRPGLNRANRRRAVLAVFASALLLLLLDTAYWAHERFWHKDLRLSVIDVGQGSASLLELPGGHTILVDGGGLSDNSAFDVGERIVAPFLRRKKIMTVDALVLSHPNSDHLNGLLYIAADFNVRQVWANGQTADTFSYRRFAALVEKRTLFKPDYPQLAGVHAFGDVTVAVLYPPGDFLARSDSGPWRDPNNNSIVLKVTLQAISLLLPGDITAAAEDELVARYGRALQSDVLLVPHHGSRHSSSDRFVAAVRPTVAIVSAGRSNRFKFPHPAVLEKYRAGDCRLLRTDRDGAVTVSTDGRRLSVSSFN